MKIQHRVSLNAKPRVRAELERLGVGVEGDEAMPSGMVTFVVDEAAPSWPRVAELVSELDGLDLVSTKFTKKEIEQAAWVQLEPSWHHGYPQPDDGNSGYLTATYDLSDYCGTCGTGAVQKAPFQMKGEPKWGSRNVLQLNWVFGEYFVTPQVWSDVFKPLGVENREVLDVKGRELKTVVQLVVTEEVNLDVEGLPGERCAVCGRAKYHPVTKGWAPKVLGSPGGALVRSAQDFGSGGSAFRVVLAERPFTVAAARHGVKGVSFKPSAD